MGVWTKKMNVDKKKWVLTKKFECVEHNCGCGVWSVECWVWQCRIWGTPLFLASISSISRFANSSSSSSISLSHSWQCRSRWWMIVDISSNNVTSLRMPRPSCVLLAVFLKYYFCEHQSKEQQFWGTFFWLGRLICLDLRGPGCKGVCNGWALSGCWSPSQAR